MPVFSRRESVAILVLTVLLAIGSGILIWQEAVARRAAAGPPGGERGLPPLVERENGPPAVEVARPQIMVHVAGAVANPGVYSLDKGARIQDALIAAGGPLAGAKPDYLNLAAVLVDGQKVYVPTEAEIRPGAAGGTGSGLNAGSRLRVNINLAGQSQLEALPGIGPSLAARIVAYRNEHGSFQKVEDLMKVGGIGPKKFAELQPYVTAD